MTKKSVSKSKFSAQQRYDARKTEAGEHIQVNVKWKAKADVKMFKALRKRFPDDSDSAIVRAAVKKLASEKN